MAGDLDNVSDEAYKVWAQEMGMMSDPDNPTDENFVQLFSSTMRELDPMAKARGLVDVANMALALADRTLGSQVPVAKCLILDRH